MMRDLAIVLSVLIWLASASSTARAADSVRAGYVNHSHVDEITPALAIHAGDLNKSPSSNALALSWDHGDGAGFRFGATAEITLFPEGGKPLYFIPTGRYAFSSHLSARMDVGAHRITCSYETYDYASNQLVPYDKPPHEYGLFLGLGAPYEFPLGGVFSWVGGDPRSPGFKDDLLTWTLNGCNNDVTLGLPFGIAADFNDVRLRLRTGYRVLAHVTSQGFPLVPENRYIPLLLEGTYAVSPSGTIGITFDVPGVIGAIVPDRGYWRARNLGLWFETRI